MAQGGVKGKPGGGGPGGSDELGVPHDDSSEVLVGDFFYPDNFDEDGSNLVGYGIGSSEGNGGDDVLIGGTRRDVLMGGDDRDVYYGGGGDDLFIIDGEDLWSAPGDIVDDANGALMDFILVDIPAAVTAGELTQGDADALIARLTTPDPLLTHTIDGGGDTIHDDPDFDTTAVASLDFGDTINLFGITYVNFEDKEIGTHNDFGTRVGDYATIINVENVLGGGGNHWIIGNDDPNYIEVRGGDDTVYGRGGNDFLHGGSDDDDLYGGAGNDHYIGGRDADDFFVGIGDDAIFDFNANKGDKVWLDPEALFAGVASAAVLLDLMGEPVDAGLGNANKADTTLQIFDGLDPVSTVTFVDTTVAVDPPGIDQTGGLSDGMFLFV